MIKALQNSDHDETAENIKLQLVKNYSKVMHNVDSIISIVTLLCGLNVLIYNLYPTEAIHQRNKVCCIAVITV